MEHYATAQQVYAAGMIFARIGSMVMLLPGIGEQVVPPRIRLSFALLLAMALAPIAGAAIGPLPGDGFTLLGRIIHETLIGVMFGAILRLFLTSLAVAGEVVSIQTTLSFSQTANPMQAQPGESLGAFLALMGATLIFSTGLHRQFIEAMVGSYQIFAPGKPFPTADAAQLAVQTVGKSFGLGVQLAAPVIVFALVFNIATGLVGRLMPQFQVFFVASPLSVLMGLSIFTLSLGVIGVVWINRYEALLTIFRKGP
ncbi:MAG TPA: flagellar biosynthetic protein FliR [Caulobacteraceae bacterium]|nr:flagellar biosynthetic protein FliR [Caulobacteraceae bacterium]